MMVNAGESGYDPADFIVPPELGRGKSQRVSAYIQSGHYRALQVLARSGVFPFEDRNDVLRFCIQKGLETLNVLQPKLIGSVLRQTNIMIAEARRQILNAQFLEWLEITQTSVNALLARGRESAAIDLVDFYREQIESMPDEPKSERQWKLDYYNKLQELYPKWVAKWQ